MNLSRKIMGAAAALLLAIGANGQQMETGFTRYLYPAAGERLAKRPGRSL